MGYHAGKLKESVVDCLHKLLSSKTGSYWQKKIGFNTVSSLQSRHKPIMTQFHLASNSSKLSFMKKETDKLQHFKNEVFLALIGTYVGRLTRKVSTYSCECAMKEYVQACFLRGA